MIIKTLSLLFVIVFAGCGGTSPSAPASTTPRLIEPTSHQVTFIESSSSAEIMVKARGIGSSISSAHTDAQRAAVWFALNGGDNPILQNSQEKQAFATVQNDVFSHSSAYISYESGIKGKQKSAGMYNVDYVFRVNIAMLKEYLISKNIIKETQDLLGDADLPVIAVVATNESDNDFQQGVSVVSEYLQDRDFEVKRLTGGSIDKIFLNIAKNMSSADPAAVQMYAAALSSGSDIYIKVNVTKGTRKVGLDSVKKASVTLHAYYTATGKEIGATTGYSPERVVSTYSSIVAEATNDAANKLLSQIQKSWKREAKRGKAYRVIVTTPQDMVRKVRNPVYKALKTTCKKVVPNQSISNILDYTLKCKDVSNFQDLEMSIAENYAGPGQVFQDIGKGALLIIKVANSEDDAIEIE